MIEIIADWDVSAADEGQIVRLLARCFDTDFGGRSYFQQRPHFRMIWREGGQIIGHMAVMMRAIRLNGVLVDVAGLADVATHPDHRGKGIAAALLKSTVAQVRAAQTQYFLLFGTAALYGAHGFAAALNLMTYIDLRGAVTGAVKTEVPQELRVLPLRGKVWPVDAPVDLLGHLF
jgi:GNAT superfamily N-acetyltransferase